MRQRWLSCLGTQGFHRVAYTEWGDSENPHVVVCVHGLSRNSRDFDILAKRLAKNYRVLCPDMPGRGQSDWLNHIADYDYPHYLQIMTNLIARSGAEQVDWVGTSMGGLIGMFLGAQPKHPIRRMVINDIGPQVPLAAIQRIASYVAVEPIFKDKDMLRHYAQQRWTPGEPFEEQRWQQALIHDYRQDEQGQWYLGYDPKVVAAWGMPEADLDYWPCWQRLDMPLLLIHGKESDILTDEIVQRMQRQKPDMAYYPLAGIGHAPMLVAEDQVACIEQWLTIPD